MWRKKYDSLLFTFLVQFNKLSYSTGTFLDLKEKYSYTFSALLHAFGHNLTYLLNVSIISLFQVLNSIFNGIYNSTYFTYVDNSKNVYINTLLICLLKKKKYIKTSIASSTPPMWLHFPFPRRLRPVRYFHTARNTSQVGEKSRTTL